MGKKYDKNKHGSRKWNPVGDGHDPAQKRDFKTNFPPKERTWGAWAKSFFVHDVCVPEGFNGSGKLVERTDMPDEFGG